MNTAHYFFAFGRNFGQGNVEFDRQMETGIRVTLDEDMSATREIESMIAALGHAPKELLVRSDAHCVQGRRTIERMIAAERASTPSGRTTEQAL
jgi:vanillate O-demethylase monooxygenase subunit